METKTKGRTPVGGVRKSARITPEMECNVYSWAIWRQDRYGVCLNHFSDVLRDIFTNMTNPFVMREWSEEVIDNESTT
jgi:hypothetical protein